MKLMIQKWCDGAAVKLPQSMLKQMGVKIGYSIEVETQANTLMLRKATHRYNPTDILAQTSGSFPLVQGWNEMTPLGKDNY